MKALTNGQRNTLKALIYQPNAHFTFLGTSATLVSDTITGSGIAKKPLNHLIANSLIQAGLVQRMSEGSLQYIASPDGIAALAQITEPETEAVTEPVAAPVVKEPKLTKTQEMLLRSLAGHQDNYISREYSGAAALYTVHTGSTLSDPYPRWTASVRQDTLEAVRELGYIGYSSGWYAGAKSRAKGFYLTKKGQERMGVDVDALAKAEAITRAEKWVVSAKAEVAAKLAELETAQAALAQAEALLEAAISQ
jgi:hypothetical protein